MDRGNKKGIQIFHDRTLEKMLKELSQEYITIKYMGIKVSDGRKFSWILIISYPCAVHELYCTIALTNCLIASSAFVLSCI